MDRSQLCNAFHRVALVADDTWWNRADIADNYKLANRQLWNDVINSNRRLYNRRSSCSSAVTTKLEPESQYGEAERFVDNSMEPPNHKDDVQQPQQTTRDSVDPNKLTPVWPGIYKDGNTLPYSIENQEELECHMKISSLSIKNIWSDNYERETYRDRLSQKTDIKVGWEHSLNANVPEFYPSIILPPSKCSPRYSNVFGANYQSEVFPYNVDKVVEKKENVGVNYKNTSGSTSERSSTLHPQGVSSLPNLNSSHAVDKTTPRTKDLETARTDVNLWLQNVYPHRLVELSKFRAIARHLCAFANQITLPSVSTPSTSDTLSRPLYRDVVARKSEDAADKIKDDTEQNPFDELERQALEQYQSSETCLVSQDNEVDFNPDLEDRKFQDLEREAVEQYADDGDDQEDTKSPSCILPRLLVSNVELIPGKVAYLRNPATEFGENFHPTIIDGSHNIKKFRLKKPGPADKSYFDNEFTAESIVKLVIEDNKTNDESKVGHGEFEDSHKASEATNKNKGKPRKNNKRKKKKKQLGNRENQAQCSKQLQLSVINRAANSSSISLPNVFNLEEETRRMATNLKQRVLNYLRTVDLKIIADENRRPNVKNQQLKDQVDKPIQERIRVMDIEDLETYKSYIREVSIKTRATLLLQFKRIRSDIMESTSRGYVSLVSPTTSEKRRVRKIIKKCLELRNHGDLMKTRHPHNIAKRDVMDTLEVVHNTMEVIYTLSNLSKEAYEDVEYMKTGRTSASELYAGNLTLEDKSDYIRQRVLLEERSVLLVVLFPRVNGVLYDRSYERLIKSNCRSIYYDHDLLLSDYSNLLWSMKMLHETPLKQKMLQLYCQNDFKVYNMFKFLRMEARAIWDPKNWSHIIESGKIRRRINMTFLSTGRQAEVFHRILTKQPPIKLFSPSNIQADDSEIQRSSNFGGERGKLKAVRRKTTPNGNTSL